MAGHALFRIAHVESCSATKTCSQLGLNDENREPGYSVASSGYAGADILNVARDAPASRPVKIPFFGMQCHFAEVFRIPCLKLLSEL